MMTDEKKHNPFDDLAEQIDFCLSIAPSKVIEVFAKTLEKTGIRVVLAAVADEWAHPQVELTVTLKDVTAKVVSQVVDPVLRKAGVPENMVLMVAVAAGEATVRYLQRYSQQPRGGRTAHGGRGPTWDPSRMRRKP